MPRDRYAYAVSSASPRPLVQRGLIVLLLMTGFALLALAKAQHPSVVGMRAQFLDWLNPVLSVISQPVGATRSFFHSMSDYHQTVEENRLLRAENERLRHWQAAAMAFEAENKALRELTGYRPVEKVSYVTARVVGTSPGSYSQSLLINAGKEQGLALYQPVIDHYGLVGRVVDVSATTSRVLLLSDISSRVPVITGSSRQHAILAGTGGDLLRMGFLTVEQDDIQLGEPVVTTEEGGLIPGGIVIGQVFRKDKGGYMVKPVRPLKQAEYLRVIVLD